MSYVTDSRFLVGLVVGVLLTYLWHAKMSGKAQGGGQ